MTKEEIARVRMLLLASDQSPGQGKLLRMLTHSETLLSGTHDMLRFVGQQTATVPQLYEALFEVRASLQSVYETLRELESLVMNVRVSLEVPSASCQLVMKLLGRQASELDDLLWILPRKRRPADEQL